MDPIITPVFIAGHVASKLIDKATATVTSRIRGMSQKRVQKFMETFCAEVAFYLQCQDNTVLNERIDDLLKNEEAAEVLFELCRSVAMSRTRDLGPRIIAALGARIVAEGRGPSEDEELLLVAAESLSDQQIGELVGLVKEAQTKVASSEKGYEARVDGSIEYLFGKEEVDSNWPNTVQIGPLNIAEALGRWSVQPKSLGLIEDDLRERTWSYSEDSERHIDADGEVREISWWILLPKCTCDFVALVQRISVGHSKK